MNAVLISIKPKWCELILSGKKTVEIRKTRPRMETPFKCYIYCTEGRSAGKELFLDNYGERPRPGWVFPVNHETALHMGMTPMNGKVVGEFVCDGIAEIKFEFYDAVDDAPEEGFYQWWGAPGDWPLQINSGACLTHKEWQNYLGTQGGFAWHISDLKIYDEPKRLKDFMKKSCDFAASCGACHHAQWGEGHTFEGCELCVNRAPQSWCYVEEIK